MRHDDQEIIEVRRRQLSQSEQLNLAKQLRKLAAEAEQFNPRLPRAKLLRRTARPTVPPRTTVSGGYYHAKFIDLPFNILALFLVLPTIALIEGGHDPDHPMHWNRDEKVVLREASQSSRPEIQKRHRPAASGSNSFLGGKDTARR